ncbi:MAG: hypothetical protein LBE38_01640 [Deltaproteobacteria bacterium]|nr:hypothetical protein [Deltaproteobacteria bacterium]
MYATEGPLAVQAYKHEQITASPVWSITYNLGAKVLEVVLFDAAGVSIFSDLDYGEAALNYMVVNFIVPVSGTTYIRSF